MSRHQFELGLRCCRTGSPCGTSASMAARMGDFVYPVRACAAVTAKERVCLCWFAYLVACQASWYGSWSECWWQRSWSGSCGIGGSCTIQSRTFASSTAEDWLSVGGYAGWRSAQLGHAETRESAHTIAGIKNDDAATPLLTGLIDNSWTRILPSPP